MSDDNKAGRNFYDLLSQWGLGIFLVVVFAIDALMRVGKCGG